MCFFRDLATCATYVVVAFGSFSALLPMPARSQQVGTAAAVNPSAQARGEGGARTIVIGHSISHRERIQTTSAGSVQLLFVDKTSMTIGPNSDLAIDEYVYDPAANTGKLAATLTKGVMRFVGGQVSHTGNAQITTPGGVVGIRGGVGIIGTNHVFIGYGQGTVTGGSQTVILGAGDYTQTAPGTPPTNPTAPPPGLIGALLANFQSQGGQGGGAPATNEGVNRARTVASGTSGGTIATAASASTVAAQTQSQRAAPVTQTFTAIEQTVAISTTEQVVRSLPPPPPPPPPLPPPPEPLILTPTPVSAPATTPPPPVVSPPQFTGPAFAFNMSNCCGLTGATSNAPYLPQTFATGDNRFISPVMGYRQTSTSQNLSNHANPANVSPTPFLQWGIDITGSGANQSSWLSVMTGTLIDNDNGVALSGGFGATRRGAATQTMGRAFGYLSSTPGSVVVDDAHIPLSATVNQQDYVAATNHYRNVQAQFSPTGTSALTNFAFTQQLTRTSAPTGLGVNRPGDVLTGWTGGLMQTVNGSSATSPFATLGTAQILLDPTSSRVQASFDVVNTTPGSLDSLLFASFKLGSVNPSRPAQSAYVDRDNFAAGEAISLDGTQQIQQSSVNGRRATSSTTVLVNMPRSVAQTILPGTTICQCDYTRWGFWSTDTRRPGLFGGSRADQGHLMTWVAGQLPNAGEVPATGAATYDGHVVANVRNGNAQYVAAGSMTNTVNFGSRSGTAQVTAFDGANYSGALVLDRNDPRYLGAGLSSNVGNRTMIMTGNLFRGTQSPVGEMGGNVFVGGTNYLGSGIFAGRMR